MTYNRERKFAELPADKFGPDGKRICVWCDGPLPPRKLRWCSQKCVSDYLCRSSQTGVRRVAEERDRGICAVCGIDTKRLERIVERLGRLSMMTIEVETSEISGYASHGDGPMRPLFRWETVCHSGANRWREKLELAVAILEAWAGRRLRPIGSYYASVRTLWEADHIVPLVEGGDPGPENIRTLCLPDHRRATRELHGRLATERRRQKAMEAA